MHNDKSLKVGVTSGLSERSKISETPEKLGMTHVNERTNKPRGGGKPMKSHGGMKY